MWTSGLARIGRSVCARSANCSRILTNCPSGAQFCGPLRTAQTAATASTSSSILRLSLQSPASRLVRQQMTRNELTVVRDYRTLANSRSIQTSQRLSDDSKDDSKRDKDKKANDQAAVSDEEPKGLWNRFKWMFRRYWYLAVPVHALTSAVWFGSFYMIAKSGIDVIGLLEYIQIIPDSWIVKLKGAPAGAYLAVAYLLYKLVSPARYFVTIYGTHSAIKILRRTGHLRTSKEMGVSLQKKYKKRRDEATHLRADMVTRWEKQTAKRGFVKPRPPKSE
uniref:DUF1279 domain-containing protein n=1 Tax=Plectus sambesii TaxID=2011161 RepID=A0A914W954_9BILA